MKEYKYILKTKSHEKGTQLKEGLKEYKIEPIE